mmetsp:Transcript_67551/g.162172  ORF Transcript_67551/g.162172 Transcript_67551/m.162172 type:complete len:540 (-) Transcript_67551:63-1682(-)
MSCLRRWSFAFAAAACWELLWLTPASAQIHSIEGEEMPAPRTMHFLYTFYIYGREDAPERNDDGTAPYVQFMKVKLSSTNPERSDASMETYDSVQLSLLKYKHFFDLVDREHFCCLEEDVGTNCAKADELYVKKDKSASYSSVGVYNFTVPFGNARRNKKPNPKERITPAGSEPVTGIYVLTLSNCGDMSDAVLSGDVIVKNAYGYLAGNEYHKLPFYGWMSMVYMFLAVVWMLLTLRWWRNTVAIQNCITVVIVLGLLECFFWWNHYNSWNSDGYRNNVLFVCSLLASVVKNIFSYMLVLVASLGWGVTRPFLDSSIMLKIQAITWLYIVLDVIKEVVLAFRHSHSLPIPFVLLCLLPVSLLNGVIFYWIFAALSNLMESLQDRRQDAKLMVFKRLWLILVVALSIATLTLLYHIFHMSGQSLTQWTDEWLYSDGISHLLFLAVLTAIMLLWAPSEHSQRYAYSAGDKGAGDDEKKKLKEVGWAEEEDDDDEESFWKQAKGAEAAGKAGGGAAGSVLKDTMADLDKIVGDEIPVEKTA